jgi:putative membrane protein
MIAPLALAVGIAACGDQTTDTAETDREMEAAAADTDADAESGGLGQTPPVNLVQDLAAGPVGVADAAITGGDTEAFLRNAALGGMYEIQAGQIALDKAGSPVLRELGQMLIDDHTRLNMQIEQAAMEAGVDFAPPAQLDERRQGLIDNLMAASDTTFDAAFLHQQEAAHLETLTLLASYEARGDVEPLAMAAREAQPVIRQHLEMIHDNLGAAVDGE